MAKKQKNWESITLKNTKIGTGKNKTEKTFSPSCQTSLLE